MNELAGKRDLITGANSGIDGYFDTLINNAAIQTEYASHKIPTEEFDRVLSTNLRGAFLFARETIKHFLSQDRSGIIINVSSVHEAIPRSLYLTDSISKGGIGNLTRTLALQYADRKIRVNGFSHRTKLHTSPNNHSLSMGD